MVLVIPNQKDVLFGKGIPINRHPGNNYFRSIVDEVRAFLADNNIICKPKRKQRRELAEQILNRIHQVGGRFLVQVKDDANSSNGGVDNVMDDDSSSHSNSGINNDEGEIHPTILARGWAVVNKEQAMRKVLSRLRERRLFGQTNVIEECLARSVQAKHKKYDNESILPKISQHLAPIDVIEESRARSVRAEHKYYDNESIPGRSVPAEHKYHDDESIPKVSQHLAPILLSPTMNMLYETWRASLGPAAMASSTMTRNGIVKGNETLSTSQIKESYEFDITQGPDRMMAKFGVQAKTNLDTEPDSYSMPLIKAKDASVTLNSNLDVKVATALLELGEIIKCTNPDPSKKKQAVEIINYKDEHDVYSPEITTSTNDALSIVRPVTGHRHGRSETAFQPLAEVYEGPSAGSVAISTRVVGEIGVQNSQRNMSHVAAGQSPSLSPSTTAPNFFDEEEIGAWIWKISRARPAISKNGGLLLPQPPHPDNIQSNPLHQGNNTPRDDGFKSHDT